jgi:hypothetical protein
VVKDRDAAEDALNSCGIDVSKSSTQLKFVGATSTTLLSPHTLPCVAFAGFTATHLYPEVLLPPPPSPSIPPLRRAAYPRGARARPDAI